MKQDLGPGVMDRRRAAAAAAQQRLAMQQWEDEGGAAAPPSPPWAAAPGADAELAQLRMRVIALEGMVMALLVRGSGAQRKAAVAMAAHIRPRPGRTPHPLTVGAASRIVQVVGRARRLASGR